MRATHKLLVISVAVVLAAAAVGAFTYSGQKGQEGGVQPVVCLVIPTLAVTVRAEEGPTAPCTSGHLDEHFMNGISRLDPCKMQLTDFELNQDSWLLRFAIDDSHGRVWFTEFGAGKIGWITGNSSAVEQPAPLDILCSAMGALRLCVCRGLQAADALQWVALSQPKG
jgi:hypothetical protein